MNKNKYYLNNWSNATKDEILDEFEYIGDRSKINILFASYTYESYEGEAFLIVEKDNMLYEVNASHCSCYGLENQFDLEETSIQAIEHRLQNSTRFGNSYWDTKNIFRNELIDFIKNYKYNERYLELVNDLIKEELENEK